MQLPLNVLPVARVQCRGAGSHRPACALLLGLLLGAFLAATPQGGRAAEGTTSDATLPQAMPAPAGEGSDRQGDPAPCELPAELAPSPDPLPGFARALKEGPRPLTVVVLGSLSGAAKTRAVAGFPPRLQARLQSELAARAVDLPLKVEMVGRSRATAAELARLVKGQVLPLKPALVIWQVGRADARQGNPPHRFGQSLKEGLEILHHQGIDTILADIQFHPQFEALYRTDDYRDYVRWVAGKRDLPLLRRYEMIEHWSVSGLIDLDSGDDAMQQAAFGFIQECLAYHTAGMIVGGAGLPGR